MNLGCIGCGMMGSIIVDGILRTSYLAPADIIASARSESTRQAVSNRFGIRVTASNAEVADISDVIILSVRPREIPSVIDEIRSKLTDDKILITIAGGISTAMIQDMLGDKHPSVIRVNPNTPSRSGHGLIILCAGEGAGNYASEVAESVFSCLGKVEHIPEDLFDIANAVTGCSPAYVYMFIEAMADAAVEWGFPRKQAYQIIAQGVLGSAHMVLESGMHPGELKDMVCSPGGTTIKGVRALEHSSFRSSIIEAISAVMEKTQELNKP